MRGGHYTLPAGDDYNRVLAPLMKGLRKMYHFPLPEMGIYFWTSETPEMSKNRTKRPPGSKK
jgi:hypothetical protein